MNIINQTAGTASFKGISPEVIERLGDMPRPLRRGIADHYNTLFNSDVVDLVMIGDKVGVKLLKPLPEFGKIWLDDIKAGSEFLFNNASRFRVSDERFIRCEEVKVDGKETNLDFLLGYQPVADTLLSSINADNERGQSIAPQFGALLDSFYKLAEKTY